jgi:protein CpxP
MKKQISILILMLFAGLSFVNAQGFARRTVEERVKMVHQKIDSAFKLDATKMTEVDSIFASAYRAQDKLREDMVSGGGQPDFQAMREKMQPINDERDAKLKKALGDDNYKTWKEQIEPTMRGGRGGNRGGGNN